MALSVGTEGISYLDSGHWEVSLSYRYLYSDTIFIGDKAQPPTPLGKPSINSTHSLDLAATYAFTPRVSATLTVPFFYGQNTSRGAHDGINEHTMSAGGLGDIRLLTNVWLLDPTCHKTGNIALSFGVKVPTGEYNAHDTSFQRTGPIERPVVTSIQPGDGGFGVVLELHAYQKLFTNVYGYLDGQYLLNPRGTNGTQSTRPNAAGMFTVNSVPDQFLGRLGVLYNIWPAQGFSISLGGRIEGQPVHDLIGSSNGFRFSGYAIAIEPGTYYTRGSHTLSLITPVALYRDRTQSVLDKQQSRIAGRNIHGGGGVYDFLFIAGYSHRF